MTDDGLCTGGAGLARCREQFPALGMEISGYPVAFLDGPGGTQVPRRVAEAMTSYLHWQNANSHGMFATSRATDEVVERARGRLADLLGAGSPDEIAFGCNSTSLLFHLARMIGRDLEPGDEVLITELDHEANRGPWLALRDGGVVVREARVDTATCQLDMEDLAEKVGPRTRVVAVGAASNAVGTINNVPAVRRLAHHAGALLVVDAVHYVPHVPLDAVVMGCDFLVCSAYKFFGPHLGVLYGRREAFERLRCHKVEPQLDSIPHRIETGTPNFEGIAGAAAAVEFIAGLGTGGTACASERAAVLAGMRAVEAYERGLAKRLHEGLTAIPGVRLYGPPPGEPRTPTISFVVKGMTAGDVAEELGDAGIFVWDGDFYATTLIKKLGLAGRGGLVRIGLAPYTTREEIERTIEAVARVAQ
ncbi:MAG: cysteine desulfurase-like protein [Bacillota bacterium]|nr:cysteine desulfurase-like protein [Bacillota bacterium]